MNMEFIVKRDFAKNIIDRTLENPGQYSWSLQGFGMLRYYVSDAVRLAVWDSAYRVTGVSDIHTHPWSFTSWILAGVMSNRRFDIVTDPPVTDSAVLCKRSRILPGPGGGLLTPLPKVHLLARKAETYHPGGYYDQASHEIHRSLPVDGTVTLNFRKREGDDVAEVFWPSQREWVSAEPREATNDEKIAVLQRVVWP